MRYSLCIIGSKMLCYVRYLIQLVSSHVITVLVQKRVSVQSVMDVGGSVPHIIVAVATKYGVDFL